MYRFQLTVMTVAVVVLGPSMFTGAAVNAASFDCKKAKAPVEVLICLDEELSGLDAQMGDLYRRAVQTAAEVDKKGVRDVQRAWLKSRLALCNIPTKRGMAEQAALAARECLKGVYRERIAALHGPADRSGGTGSGGVDSPGQAVAAPGTPAEGGTATPVEVPLPAIDVEAMTRVDREEPDAAPMDLGTIMAQIASGTFDALKFAAEHPGARAFAAGALTAKSFDGAANSATLFIEGPLLCTLRDEAGLKRASTLLGGEMLKVEGVFAGLTPYGSAQSPMLDPCILAPQS